MLYGTPVTSSTSVVHTHSLAESIVADVDVVLRFKALFLRDGCTDDNAVVRRHVVVKRRMSVRVVEDGIVLFALN